MPNINAVYTIMPHMSPFKSQQKKTNGSEYPDSGLLGHDKEFMESSAPPPPPCIPCFVSHPVRGWATLRHINRKYLIGYLQKTENVLTNSATSKEEISCELVIVTL
jgi:hypothetical protein